MARFGLPALLPATALARLAFREPEARALFAGHRRALDAPLGRAAARRRSGWCSGCSRTPSAGRWPAAAAGAIAAALEAEARALGRRDRDGPTDRLARRAARGPGGAARPHAAAGARGRGRPPARRLPPPAGGLPLRPGRLQARLGARRPDPVARPADGAGRHGPPRRHDARGRRGRGRRPPRPGRGAAVRAARPADHRRPVARARGQARRLGLLPRPERLDRAT